MDHPTNQILPRPPLQTPEERFQRVMDELDILASVLADIEDEDVSDQLTMWIDYMVYRLLYDADQDQGFEPAARECRKLIMAHLDQMAWDASAETGAINMPVG